MGFKDINCEGLGRIHLAQYRIQGRALVNTVMELRIP